ncbi:MAG: hypothetical protein DHS20C06_17090 [Hyphobacterium sp.]|nr:MAG: hypothetical protein DHS20C06_17090 [Hyphobacterium sp.]
MFRSSLFAGDEVFEVTLMSGVIRTIIVAAMMVSAPMAQAIQADNDPRFEQFNPSTREAGRQTVDYTAWSDMLREIVLNVGFSDRRSARGNPVFTGTRIFTGNNSRYRYESNRVILHLFEDFHTENIGLYRAELEALPDQIDFNALHPNEQLAYWLNLYTVTVVEQMGLLYPRHEFRRINAYNSNERLYDAPLLTVMGEPLSLNDIQYNIVYRYWDDPLVIYGFFNGTIGSPRIRREAFEANTVWTQLESNAREFVNSLRGVDSTPNRLDISEHYQNARPYLFPDWPIDIRAHLMRYADEDVAELVSRDMPLRAIVNEWGIADMTNGSSRCGGAISQTTTTADGTQRDASFCGNLPDNGRILMDFVIERRMRQILNGETGDVYIRDLPDRPNRNVVIDLDVLEDEDEDADDADNSN